MQLCTHVCSNFHHFLYKQLDFPSLLLILYALDNIWIMIVYALDDNGIACRFVSESELTTSIRYIHI